MPFVECVVIAAAGMATRLGLGRPKCLVEFGGVPLIVRTLSLLADVPEIRIVTGFGEREVIDTVLQGRRDVVFVRNPAYRTTTTLGSYVLGARYWRKNCLFMDADILLERKSFQDMLERCAKTTDPIIGTTKTKTKDAVYVRTNEHHQVTAFSRNETCPQEWANVAWLPPSLLEAKNTAVFEQLALHLPLQAHEIISFEIDTPADLALAQAAFIKHKML
jgi:choline kinase